MKTLIQDIKNIKCGRESLRRFGLSLGFVLILISCFLFWKGEIKYIYFLSFGGIFSLPGIIFPFLLKPVYKLWTAAAFVIGWVVTRIILTVLFYSVVTPLGWAMKMFKRDLIDTGFRKGKGGSYWINLPESGFVKENYKRQF